MDVGRLVLAAEVLALPGALLLPEVFVLPGALLLPGVFGADGFLVAVAGVEDSAELREAPNSASMTSPPAEPALLGRPALFGLPALFGRPALFGLPRASALGTFGRRVAMTLL
ncbi:hypothetical protein StoSoilB5_12650 [Arthrobacter sp. StoSoilB5]|nr:hypothetical protein StoSoilB5_12650 [Arthrobacter sp. StoSoilB5]